MIHTLSTLLHECTFVKIRLMYSFQGVKSRVRDSHVSRMGKQRTIFLRAIVTYYPPDLGAWQMHP